MISDKEFVEKLWPQNCGDTLKILEKSTSIRNKEGKYLWKCQFIKYPNVIYNTKAQIIRGVITNPEIERVEFVEKLWPQNCGDTLKVLEKTDLRDKQGKGGILFKCQFQKYPYETFQTKSAVIQGKINNPQIEQVEFAEKLWLQNCGDTLRILRKTNEKKNGNYLWECEFINYPYTLLEIKSHILRGVVNNPKMENFVGQSYKQNCRDILKVIEKTNQKNKWGFYLYKCEFTKYPCEILALKQHILDGKVLNPQIEQQEFIGHSFLQNCGDTLKVIKKNSDSTYLCCFVKYPCEISVLKNQITRRVVDNPNLPWKTKENLKEYIVTNYSNSPSLYQLSKDLNISISRIGSLVNEYNLRSYINYNFNIQESIIKEYVRFLNIECETKTFDRELNYNELDIYIPKYNLGIEYNGNIWHSTKFKAERNYHQTKSLLFKEKINTEIFHIFEYEYLEKEEIIKSLIKSKLGLFDKKFYARQCKVKELKNKEYQDFCNQNHLQGEAGAKVKLGLFYKEELVQIMSFSLPRFSLDYDWEIIRECSKLGYAIIGGKEKLWKYFLQKYNPQNCLSYCDFGKFNGNSYLKLGFKLKQLNKPGFVWYNEKENQVYWRNPYKNKEMQEKGYFKIYDVGQLVFIWKRENS